jgi:hypothetical protein
LIMGLNGVKKSKLKIYGHKSFEYQFHTQCLYWIICSDWLFSNAVIKTEKHIQVFFTIRPWLY